MRCRSASGAPDRRIAPEPAGSGDGDPAVPILVLRGGCFVTQQRLLRPTWRNFYTPDRRGVWVGFPTCAID
jgi:formylglycine-generating enzyme required for sulfatase activity